MVERGGDKLKDLVGNKYPWAEVPCKRPDCLICRSTWSQPESVPPAYRSKLGKCYMKSCCYQIVCVQCLMEGRKAVYIGETSRTAWERIREHLGTLKRCL